MAVANTVQNSQLLDMLKQAEKAQREKACARVQQFMQNSTASQFQPATCAGMALQTGKVMSTTSEQQKPHLGELDVLRTKLVPLTRDEIEWLSDIASKYTHVGMSGPLQALISWANCEPPEAKRKIFLVVRCRRCSAGAKGGVKREHEMELYGKHWQWLENVKERCKHASVEKTIRIIVDFYMALCKEDAHLEQQIFRPSMASEDTSDAGTLGKQITVHEH